MSSLLFAALTLWAQANPGSETDPVSKKGPVSAVPEPELACAGSRPELLDFPTPARSTHLEGNVTADLTITPDGKLKDLQLTSSLSDKSKAEIFEKVVRAYLEQSTFLPGCEKEPKRLHFEFFFKGDPGPERRALVEFKTPDTFQISVNPAALDSRTN